MNVSMTTPPIFISYYDYECGMTPQSAINHRKSQEIEQKV